jgi:hypothetical protein
MTTLTMRMIRGDFVVTVPDVEPMKFKYAIKRSSLNVRFAPKATQLLRSSGMTRSATSGT